MKRSLITFLICVFINCSMSDITGDFTELDADIVDASCHGAKLFGFFRPSIPGIERVSFILRTPCNNKEIGVTEAEKLRDVPEFDPSKKTVFFVTGWRSEPNDDYVNDMAKAHHCRNDNNFVVVNTGGSLDNLNYVDPASFTGVLGAYIAEGINNMGIPGEKIQLVGHSLGAHIVGNAGQHFYELTGTQIQRITGLDPANPCFRRRAVHRRLDQNDAKFVDIIHTNPDALGLLEPIGHVDFYPDGHDLYKNGCDRCVLFCKEAPSVCSHQRAVQYYTESVYPGNESNFKGTHCTSSDDIKNKTCTGESSVMGYAADINAKGEHYVSVRSDGPFGENASRAAATSSSSTCGLCPE